MTYWNVRWTLAVSVSALLAGCGGSVGSLRKAEAPTVGQVATSNMRVKDSMFGLVAKTPSTLRLDAASEVDADTHVAIASYDRIVELRAAPEVRAEALRRGADLRIQAYEQGAMGQDELQVAIRYYRLFLDEYPQQRNADRAAYQLARAYELNGDDAESVEMLQRLAQRYPNSERVADTRFRAAEKLYLLKRYDEAETEYAAVVAMDQDQPYYEHAQYKYGWTLYKQSKYDPALRVFLSILDRELPAGGELVEAEPALARVEKGKADMVRDALRVTGLSFAALGGGVAINEYLESGGAAPRYTPLLYASLGEQMMGMERYTDAAESYTAFVQRHPQHELGPRFQAEAIAAYEAGGFTELLVVAKQDYIEAYAPDSAYWQGRTPTPEVLSLVQQGLTELGQYYYAEAQAVPAEGEGADPAQRRGRYLEAARWYARSLELFPSAADVASTHLLYADALLEGGRAREAAEQYAELARRYPDSEHAPEAAYASIQTYHQLAEASTGAAREEGLSRSIDASLDLVARYPQHAGAHRALTRAAEDAFELKRYSQAVEIAKRVLAAEPPADPGFREVSFGVMADAYFLQGQYANAEGAYIELLRQTPPSAPKREERVEQLAASVYKQGEAARDQGDLRAAAQAFARVGKLAPTASIRAAADYDAAVAYMTLEDWRAAETALENFRRDHAQHALIPDVDKKLAFAYQNDGNPGAAGAVYSRIAARVSEPAETRRDAAWLAAELQDEAGNLAAGQLAYQAYLERYPQPLDRAMQARQRLAEIAIEHTGNGSQYVHWLQEIVRSENTAGATDETRLYAARANLELGRLEAANARAIALREPVAKSLPVRKQATETAIATLSRASSYGFAEVSTAATYEIGRIYRDFSKALMQSQRPAKLDALALEQYELLLEEQAYPFEEKAIAAYETNLGRLREGLWDEWILKSTVELADLVPAQYSKQELRDKSYDSLF